MRVILSFTQRTENDRKHRVDLPHDFVIPESENTVTQHIQISGALVVLGNHRTMLSAVDFNNQLSFEANEIDNVRRDRILPTKFESAELACAQILPELSFGIDLVPAQ